MGVASCSCFYSETRTNDTEPVPTHWPGVCGLSTVHAVVGKQIRREYVFKLIAKAIVASLVFYGTTEAMKRLVASGAFSQAKIWLGDRAKVPTPGNDV